MEKMIEAVNVSYIYQTKYQKTKALSEVSCSFERGKVYAITGKSGSGKSTFLSLLAGLENVMFPSSASGFYSYSAIS